MCRLPLLYTLSANGRAGIMFLVTVVTMTTTPIAHTGKAVTVVGNMVFVGEMVFSLVYRANFAEVDKTAKFFFVSFAIVQTALVIYIILHSVTSSHLNKADKLESDSKQGETTDNHHEIESAHDSGIIGIKEMVCSLKLHLYVWSGSLILSTNMMLFTNVCLLLQSLALGQYENSLVTTMMCTVIVSQLSFGTMYDAITVVSNKICLIVMVAICNVLSFGTLLLSIDNILVVSISVAFMSCTMGGALATFLPFSSNLFGTANIGMVQGILMTCYAIFSLIFNYVTGAIYDHFAP